MIDQIPPPQNLDAEESLIGACLISSKAIEAAIPLVEPEHFYRPTHGLIFEAIRDLYTAGVEVDAIVLADALERRGADVDRAVVHTLAALVPASTYASQYATIVREHWKRREVMSALGRALEAAIDGPTSDEALAIAERALLDLRTRVDRGRSAVVSAQQIMVELGEKFDNPPDTEGGVVGPFDFFPRFLPGRLYVLGGYAKDGKALDVATPLPTPTGWTTMGEIEPGDLLLDETGRPCRVTFASPIMLGNRCYRVRFSDGSEIVADADHQWLTTTGQARASESRVERRVPGLSTLARPQQRLSAQVVTTERIRATLRGHGGRREHAVAVALPLRLDERALALDPYTLGVWLGDGRTSDGRIYSEDEEIVDGVRAAGYLVRKTRQPFEWRVYGLKVQLRALGVLGAKRIPADYQRASVSQRLGLLRGLMDTDGYASRRGQCEFATCSRDLADDVYELLSGLGVKTTIRESRAMLRAKDCGPRFRLTFTTATAVFGLRRKRERLPLTPGRAVRFRYVDAVDEVPSRAVRCVQVDSSSSLYLAGRAMIPTHNTALGMQVARGVATAGSRVGIVTMEMGWRDLADRMVASFGVPYRQVHSGRIGQPYRAVAAAALGEIAKWSLDVIDDVNADATAIHRYQKLGRYDLLIVDHIHRIDWVERRDLEREVKALTSLALAEQIPVLALAQLNRDKDFRRPTMASFRESAVIEQEASLALAIWRERDGGMPTNAAELLVMANRYGRTGSYPLTFVAHEVRFEPRKVEA